MSEPPVPFTAKALYEYKSDYEDDLTFGVGQLITVTAIEDEEWLSGTYDGKSGMFPKNFVEVVKGPAPPASRPKERSSAKSPSEVQIANSPEQGSTQTTEQTKVHDTTQDEGHGNIPATEDHNAEDDTGASKGNTLKAPLPVFPGHKTNDPYSVKKQFLGTGKSSYVPKITPRDDYNIVGHAHTNVPPKDAEVVKSTTYDEPEVEEPKVSLKERIALLQKRQQEEAEREEAALKKKEERKLKQAEEKQKLKEKKEEQLRAAKTGESLDPEAGSSPLDESANREGPLSEEETSTEHHTAARSNAGEGDDDEEEEGDEGEEEDEDDEELKRKKLVERMAKISGGRNMFGMMGMGGPFGAPPSTNTTKKSTKPKKEEPVERQEPVPILPGAVPPLPKELGGTSGAAEDGYEESGKGVDKGSLEHDTDFSRPPIPRESSSLAEDDDLSDEIDNSKFPEAGDEQSQPKDITPLTPKDVNIRDHVISDSEHEAAGNKINDEEIKITNQDSKPSLDAEPTGYEADEDISDFRKRNSQEVGDKAANAPPVGLGGAPAPPVSHPVIPQSPPRPNVATSSPSSPATSRVPPPIPGTFPQSPRDAPPPIPHAPAPTSTASPPRAAPPVPQAPAPSSTASPPHAAPPVPHAPAPSSPRAAPPVPSGIPPVPVPSVPEQTSSDSEVEIDERRIAQEDDYSKEVSKPDDELRDEDSDDEFVHAREYQGESFAPPQKSATFEAPSAPFAPPPPRRTSTEVPPSSCPPPVPVATNSTGVSVGSNKRASLESNVSRSRSLKGKSGLERSRAEIALEEVEYELGNISGNSSWWIKGELPESLVSRIGVDLIYEVETNSIKKRGGRTLNYRDYYILFFDLSQVIFELEYETEDPRSTVRIVNYFSKPIPIIRKDLLENYHRQLGQIIASEAIELLGSTIHDDIVTAVLGRISNSTPAAGIVPPIGGKSYGVTIYKNFNNSNIAKIDEIRPGDILWIKNGKFSVHKSLVGNKTVSLGDNNLLTKDGSGVGYYAGVIYEFDVKKAKFKVIEVDNGGRVRKEAYKVGDMKSGKIRVFRAVGREYIDW